MLAALVDAGAEFIVVGAHALAAHGLPRATGDFDIWVRPSRENSSRVFQALIAFGAPVVQHGIGERDFEHPGSVYQIGLPPLRIDLLTSISGVSFEDASATKLEVTLGDLSFHVLGREALIANKRATGREKDRLDVEALERTKA
jgi:hypothetical protein